MERILIVNNNMHIGGAQKALVNLLWNIRDRYDVTLLLFSKEGECYKDIPPEITVMTVKSAYRYLGLTRDDTHSMRDKLGRGFFAAITRIFGRKYAIALMGIGQRKLQGFDAAISYLHNAGDKLFYGGCNDFILKHVRAKKKITFLHCDYIHSGACTPDNNRMYARFDAIAACGPGSADSFVHENPSLQEKVQIVTNCHRFDQIRELANLAPVSMDKDKLNVVTVARLSKEKSVERAVRAISRLGEDRKKVHYYIIGSGIQRNLIQQIITEKGLADCVTLCGTQSNPYGYIRAADLLLISSYSEASPLVIGEAACLGTPILSTETSSARKMIEMQGYGWVCDNSEDAMLESLRMLLADRRILDEVQNKLRTASFNNDAALTEFELLVQ